jgi:hypothetical protein
MTKDIRYNTISGLFEDDTSLVPVSVHFSEWWNGEGLTFNFDDQKHISLHSDEIRALCVVAIATGMVSVDDCTEAAYQMKKESSDRDEAIRKTREDG